MTVEIIVYGAEEICASCINLPSSIETTSWLDAALGRKYGNQVRVRYVDIDQPITDEEIEMANKIKREDLWYPVVVIDHQIVTEGNPKLKAIYQVLDKIGIVDRHE
ncbi:DUF1462 family protein [Hazenella sp. IB182357]|uniref:DUF1462 family protein n=1 Tax=Polycladospora coralii TaxID=2771432 RepID=A0A926N6X6_9BACL|nr:DUF1462 family protein [Polycladospora coralii]MBD1370896.1 DUF1462 family protein [Polycladospora coralii]MBS7529835.1 DUF1462 family protein [Polycladospora coralii]